MTNQNKPTNFWFGFALGGLTAAAAVYLLGTKQGRQKLKRIMEMAEGMEDLSPDLIKAIPQVLNVVVNNGNSQEEVEEVHEKNDHKTHSMETVIDKIKHVSQPNKYVKKFFAKGGKIISS